MAIALTWDDSALAQYLRCEEHADFKSEFFQGRVRQMSGAAPPHNEAIYGLNTTMGPLLRAGKRKLFGPKCVGYPMDQRIFVAATGDYFYADFSIVCGKPKFVPPRPLSLTNPLILFEVLSDSREKYNREDKFESYKQISSLREYLLVSQRAVLCEHFVRQADDSWNLRTYARGEDVVTLTSAGIAFPLGDVYEDVNFDADDSGGDAGDEDDVNSADAGAPQP